MAPAAGTAHSAAAGTVRRHVRVTGDRSAAALPRRVPGARLRRGFDPLRLSLPGRGVGSGLKRSMPVGQPGPGRTRPGCGGRGSPGRRDARDRPPDPPWWTVRASVSRDRSRLRRRKCPWPLDDTGRTGDGIRTRVALLTGEVAATCAPERASPYSPPDRPASRFTRGRRPTRSVLDELSPTE